MGLFTQFYQKWRLARWRKRLSLRQHEAVFHALYDEVDGYHLSKQARKNNDAMEYLYGEIEFEPFIALLSLCHPNQNTVFYDLGSGTGKAVIAAAMVFQLRKSCGIELFPALHNAAEQQKLKLKALPAYIKIAQNIIFQQADFLNASFLDADIIFINATAFFADHWQKISHHVEQLKAGSYILTSSKALRSDAFHLVNLTEVAMSWGVVRVYVQQRKLY